jgi:hypothetical protein
MQMHSLAIFTDEKPSCRSLWVYGRLICSTV